MSTFNGYSNNASPSPGDGICPSVAQKDDLLKHSYEEWTRLLSKASQSTGEFRIANDLLQLLQQIPSLHAPPSPDLMIFDRTYLRLKFALEWETTTDPLCDQSIKRTYHYLTMRASRPLTCEFSGASADTALWPGDQGTSMRHLSRLIWAWAYILSSRWVEILGKWGKEATMFQTEHINGENFWEVIVDRPWRAITNCDEGTFYAPWCMTQDAVTFEYVHQLQRNHPMLIPRPSRKMLKHSPDALHAFRLMEDFCFSERITKDCVAMALAVVLMFPEHRLNPIRLAPLAMPLAVPQGCLDSPFEKQYSTSLFECLGQCITLSCCEEGIASLLCSSVFEPNVPCNMVGAHLSGIGKALESVSYDSRIFARLMTARNPMTSSLWLAAIWMGQASKLFISALEGMPPINLSIASWTGNLQSFLQVGYDSISFRDGYVSRAQEFIAIYSLYSNATMPFAPSPPFGEVAASQLSLEVRKHLCHNHKPIRASTYWVSRSGLLTPAQGHSRMIDYPVGRLPSTAATTEKGNCSIQ